MYYYMYLESNDSNRSGLSNCGGDCESPAHPILAGIVLGFIILFTLVGNILVIIAVVGFRRLQTVTNFLLSSLAIADLTVATLVMPFALVYEVQGRWSFGWVFCHFWVSCDVMCCTASILNLCIISVDKYWAVTRPLVYNAKSKKRVVVMVAFVWVCSAMISFIPIFMGWYADGGHPNLSDPYFCGLQVNRTYAVISSMTSFYVPLSVMVFMYHRIYTIARSQAARIRAELSHIHCLGVSQRQSMRRQVRFISREHKAVRTLGIIMGFFIMCWLPFFLMYLVMPFCRSCHLDATLQAALTWLGYANSFLNPLIYAFFHRDFRHTFKRILCPHLAKSQSNTVLHDDAKLMTRVRNGSFTNGNGVERSSPNERAITDETIVNDEHT